MKAKWYELTLIIMIVILLDIVAISIEKTLGVEVTGPFLAQQFHNARLIALGVVSAMTVERFFGGGE